eukprot:g3438.t1
MSLSAAASALAPNPEAEKYSEQGHVLLQRGNAAAAVDHFAHAVKLTNGKDKVYAFALAQAQLANKNINGAIDAFQLAHRAAPEWFAPKEALQMLGAPLIEKK